MSVILAKDLGKKPYLLESSYTNSVFGLFICLFQISNEKFIPEGKCCPDRWHCLFDGTQSALILPDQTGEAETMGNRFLK